MIDVHHVDACPSKITVFLGSVNCEADAAVYPCDATDQHIEWYSDDPSIAAVNPETGYISGVSLGRTKIYAQATNGSRAGIVVEVVPAMIEEIWLESSHRNIGCGQEDVLIANVKPETAVGREIIWRCTDPTVITLTPNGYQVSINGNKLGSAVVIATAKDEYVIADCCEIDVVKPVAVESVSFGRSHARLTHNDSFLLDALVKPSEATNKKLSWIVPENNIVEVEQITNTVSRIKSLEIDGSVIITVRTEDGGFEATCKVVVDTRETVTVRYITEENEFSDNPVTYGTITFDSTGKVWHCIEDDIVFEPNKVVTNNRYQMLTRRMEKNLFDEVIVEGGYRKPIGDMKTYTDKELKLIYFLDPCGLAAYVELAGYEFYDEVKDQVDYKDAIFKMLFGREPKHYTRNSASGKWDVTAKSETQSMPVRLYLSESELIFGAHTIFDQYVLIEGLKAIGNILTLLMDIPYLEENLQYILRKPDLSLENTKNIVAMLTKSYNLVQSLGKAMVEDELADCVRTIISESIENEIIDWKKLIPTINYLKSPMCWAVAWFVVCNTFADWLQVIIDKPPYSDELLRKCADYPDYCIYFQCKNGNERYCMDALLEASK